MPPPQTENGSAYYIYLNNKALKPIAIANNTIYKWCLNFPAHLYLSWKANLKLFKITAMSLKDSSMETNDMLFESI